MISKVKRTAKAWTALLGGVLAAVAGMAGGGVIPVEASPWIALGIAVVGAVATWAVPNEPTDRGE